MTLQNNSADVIRFEDTPEQKIKIEHAKFDERGNPRKETESLDKMEFPPQQEENLQGIEYAQLPFTQYKLQVPVDASMEKR